MTSFAVFPDIHDRSQYLKPIRHILADVDAVLLPGDMTNGNSDSLHRLFNIINTYNENILAVCGNMDTERMNMWMAREGISIHRHHQMLDGIAILGCGGALPFYGDYVFSEEELAGFLEDSVRGVPEDTPKILVCHQPPYDTAVDFTKGKHVGSKAVRAFIERVQPLVAFTGHIHDATGIHTLGKTQLVNSGPIARTNQYAYLEIEDGAITTLEIRTAQALDV